jgi:1-aminocyclopropane-1-carboxylate deaminase/D-cysteine desulfhydrase-like pyridoxal-dependent ACC family enzyme
MRREMAARAIDRIEVDDRWLGRGYGYRTSAGELATHVAAEQGLTLDPTYTAKAFACALDRMRSGREVVLFWHTLSAAPMAPLLEGAPPLPPEIEHLLR